MIRFQPLLISDPSIIWIFLLQMQMQKESFVILVEMKPKPLFWVWMINTLHGFRGLWLHLCLINRRKSFSNSGPLCQFRYYSFMHICRKNSIYFWSYFCIYFLIDSKRPKNNHCMKQMLPFILLHIPNETFFRPSWVEHNHSIW